MVAGGSDDEERYSDEIKFSEVELKALKRDEELKEQLFNPKTFKQMASYVFHNLVSNKRTRDFVAKKLSRQAIDKGVFFREEELDLALEYCDRELFG